jgi:hypothetical protein
VSAPPPTRLPRLPSFKNRRTLSPLENEPRERKSSPEKNLSSDREPSANSGLDIETKNFSATGRGRSFFVDIPFYRTSYLIRVKSSITTAPYTTCSRYFRAV